VIMMLNLGPNHPTGEGVVKPRNLGRAHTMT